MTATLAGRVLLFREAELLTTRMTARAFLQVASTVEVRAGQPLVLSGDDGPLLTAEVVAVQREEKHQRIVAQPPALLDMLRRYVEPQHHTDVQVPTLLAAVLGPHRVTAAPPFDATTLAQWSTRRRTQRWALSSILRTLGHQQRPADWRFDARGNRVIVATPGDPAERMHHQQLTILLQQGGAIEVSELVGLQAGDLVDGRIVTMVRALDAPGYHRATAWLDDAA